MPVCVIPNARDQPGSDNLREVFKLKGQSMKVGVITILFVQRNPLVNLVEKGLLFHVLIHPLISCQRYSRVVVTHPHV